MRKIFIASAIAFSLACLMQAPAALAGEGQGESEPGTMSTLANHRFGLGVNYWKTIDNIDDEFDNNGFSYIVSYQYVPVWFFKVEADMEIYPELANSPDAVVSPKVFLNVGGFVYAGVGIGIYYHNGDWGDAPFYVLRAGFDIPVLPRLFLDINANYRFNDWDTITWNEPGNPGTDTIHLGAALRFTL